MNDPTETILEFREALRLLWNKSFWGKFPEQRACHFVWRFHQLEARLFVVLVLDRLGYLEADQQTIDEYPPFFRVVPASPEGFPMMIQRSRGEYGYWDNPVSHSKGETMDLRFIAFYDWDEMGEKDCHYYRVRITDFAGKPDLIGLEALVTVSDALIEAIPK